MKFDGSPSEIYKFIGTLLDIKTMQHIEAATRK